MKNNLIVKASLFTLILAFMAIGTFAIAKEVMKKEKPAEVVKVLNTETWYFTGEYDSDPTNPANYSTEPVEDKPCVTPYETICRIEAPADPTNSNQPHMEAEVENEDPEEEAETVEDQINAALSSLATPTPQPNATVKAFRQE